MPRKIPRNRIQLPPGVYPMPGVQKIVSVATDIKVCLGTPRCHGHDPSEHVPACPLFAGGRTGMHP